MKRKISTVVLVAALGWAASPACAQVIARSSDSTRQNQALLNHLKPKGPKPITHEISVGFRLNTNGWSAYTDFGKVKSKDARHSDMFYNVRLLQFEISEKKSPKEEKSMSENASASGSSNTNYIYGKINNFYAIKLGYGFRKMIAGKPDPGSVSIHWVNVAGFSLGLLKPYYVNVYSDPVAIKYAEGTKSDFLNQQIIIGSAGFSKGINEVSIIPGAHLKSALHFDFSTNNKNALGVEAGINLEYYSQSVMLMANQPATNYFFDAFVAIQFGRRW